VTATDAKKVERIRSRILGQDVLCARWGFWGQPVLLFPTAGGDAEECERFKMLHVLAPLVDSGRIKVYSCDSVGGRALTERRSHPPGWFPRVQCLFDAFVRHELVGWIRDDCRSPGIEVVAAGASIGAFNAVAAVCKHPDVFSQAIAMSGTYDVAKWLEPGDQGLDWYYSSPLHFVPHLGEGPQLERLRTRWTRASRGGWVRSWARAGSRTGWTSGAGSTATTGRPGARCSRAI
jgi:esterase/lipase superfamily enzyme